MPEASGVVGRRASSRANRAAASGSEVRPATTCFAADTTARRSHSGSAGGAGAAGVGYGSGRPPEAAQVIRTASTVAVAATTPPRVGPPVRRGGAGWVATGESGRAGRDTQP